MTPKDIDLAQKLAEAAGEAIRPFFRAKFDQEAKTDSTFVTEADRAAEAAMRAIIEAERPDDGIIGEEYGPRNEGASRQWVLDPIDGTTSFIAGRPIFGTLIALTRNGAPVLGVIDHPALGERWRGIVGAPSVHWGRGDDGAPVQSRPSEGLDQALACPTSPDVFSRGQAAQFQRVAAAARESACGTPRCSQKAVLG